jgi:hypothetical protein
MSDYGTMQTRIANELNRTDLSSEIQDSIQSAIKYYEGNRFWFNESIRTTTTTADDEFVDEPSDLVEIDSLTITISTIKVPLLKRTYQYLEDLEVSTTLTGIPREFALYNKQIRLYPIPDDSYTLTLSGAKRLTSLSATGDTNDWMTTGEELIRSRAVADIRANVLRDQQSIQEQMNFSQYPNGFLCAREKGAFYRLKSESAQRETVGRLRPTFF